MRLTKDQRGAISAEHVSWMAFTAVALVIMSAIFVPTLKNSIVGMVKDTTVTTSNTVVSCPIDTVPAIDQGATSTTNAEGDKWYNIYFESNPSITHGWRPASHINTPQGDELYAVAIGADTYICVMDTNEDGNPDS